MVNFQLIIDKIWSLPKLTNCDVDIAIENQPFFYVPSIISLSLECVTILQSALRLNQINRLFERTPNLKRLSASINSFCGDNYMRILHHITSPLSMLIRLNICFPNCFDISTVIVFLQNIPNLRHLNIDIHFALIEGHQWEQIIRNYLPKLKTFQLKMKKIFFSDQNIQEQADELINSFRNSFWIDEHQWFVRCFTWDRAIHLCTLSKQYDPYESVHPDSWRSTYPHDNQQEFYNHMTSIDDKTFFDQSISSNISLPNIKYLRIKLPINDQFWSIVPNLNQLRILVISYHFNTFQSQLQAILDRVPCFYRICINQCTSLCLQTSLFKYTKTSVRELNLRYCHHYFNEKECIIASTRSSLGVQCEVLSIQVINPESIIYLVKNMIKLRMLRISRSPKKNYKELQLTRKQYDTFREGEKLNTRDGRNTSHSHSHTVTYSHFFSFCHIHARYLYERKFF